MKKYKANLKHGVCEMPKIKLQLLRALMQLGVIKHDLSK